MAAAQTLSDIVNIFKFYLTTLTPKLASLSLLLYQNQANQNVTLSLFFDQNGDH